MLINGYLEKIKQDIIITNKSEVIMNKAKSMI